MRVIAGEFRSRVLKSVPGLDTRPTPDRLREALFSALGPRVQDAVFADLYAGTGAVGIEALSRGARRALFVEHHRHAVGVIRDNLKTLGIEDRADVKQAKASAIHVEADIVFVDPPYDLANEYSLCLEALGRGASALVLVQHDKRQKLKDQYGRLTQTRVMRQGDNCISFYTADLYTSDPPEAR